jgi:cellulose synthase/poly-beta-1,6-N-acetylglucosamine synthase-like glycosyltransferase
MTFETLSYPFLFAAIYFEAFLLVTLLSEPRKKTEQCVPSSLPSVAMIVPCYNEGTTILRTTTSLLALEYPADKLHVVLVNDGSTDNTKDIMRAFEENPRVTVIHQENGGKHVALNTGITARPTADIVGCLDADSFVEPNALMEMVPYFNDSEVGAATAAMSVHTPKNFLEHIQNAEYVLGIALRHILARVNGLHVTPGPFSLYRRSLIESLGGFKSGHNTEDMEIALRIQRSKNRIESVHTARVFTKVPRSVPALIKQRTRWTTGFLRNVLYDYSDLVGNPRYGSLGLLILPLGFAAIGGGVLLFLMALWQISRALFEVITNAFSVPFSYTLLSLTPRLTEWFYVPITMLLLLALVAGLGSVAFIMFGKRISQTPGKLLAGIVGYMFIYGLIAPLWLLRSVADVATNTRRPWR